MDYRANRILRMTEDIMLEFGISDKEVIREYRSQYFVYVETETIIYKKRINEERCLDLVYNDNPFF